MGLLSKATDWLHSIGKHPDSAVMMQSEKPTPKPITLADTDYTPDSFRFDEYDPYARINPAEASAATDLRPSGVTNQSLRLLHFRSTLLSSIITRRVGQLSHFAVPQSKIEQGFHIVPRGMKSDSKLTPEQKAKCAELETYISNLGILENRPSHHNFYEFLKQATIDSLLLDAVCIERIYSKTGKLVAFNPVDAAAIQPVYSEADKTFVYKETSLSTGAFINTYTPLEMAYVCRNRVTDRRWAGYGQSEAERLIGPLTCHLYAMEYNKRILKNGHNTSGVISLKGNVSRQQFAEFKRDLYAFIRGVENTGNAAIVNAPQGVEILNGIKTPDEIGFSELMNLLVRQCCSMYNMDPEELHWLFSESGQSAKRELSNEEFRIQYSRDQGLRLLLTFFERLINEEILKYVDPDYVFEFTGMNPQTNADKISNTVSAMQFMTLNEARELMKLPKLKDKTIGEMVCNQMANAIYAQQLQNEQADAQQADAPAQPVGPDGNPVEGDPEQVMGAGEGTPAKPTGDQSRVVQQYLQSKGYPDETIEHVMSLYNQGGMTFEEIQKYAEQGNPDSEGGYGGTPEVPEEPGNADLDAEAPEQSEDAGGAPTDERGNPIESDPLGIANADDEAEPFGDTEETPEETPTEDSDSDADEKIDQLGEFLNLSKEETDSIKESVNSGELTLEDVKNAAMPAEDTDTDTDELKVRKLAEFLNLTPEETDSIIASLNAGEITLQDIYEAAKPQ